MERDKNKWIFQTRLKEERKINGLTQKQMAEKLELAVRTYINYEQKGANGRQPDLELLVKMADILNVSIDYLLGRED